MITRVCISINNRCNLNCQYCHFHEKKDSIITSNMDIFKILDNIRNYIEKNNIKLFKIGFVGNGEPFLEFEDLHKYISHISDLLKSKVISAYTITNGTILDRKKIEFLVENNVTIGFSLDGLKDIHNKWRCNSFDTVMKNIELYRDIVGNYPPLNCTVSEDILKNSEEVIKFFSKFNSRITFSRMIGKYSIPLDEFNRFLNKASEKLNIRRGGYDCTMYGGMCGAGIDNLFYANGKVFICGNCIDIDTEFTSDTPLEKIKFNISNFDRKYCYKESILKL